MAAVRVDGRPVVTHARADGDDRPAVGGADLSARPHRFAVEHAEGIGHAAVRVSWRRAGEREWLPVPPWALFHRAADADAAADRRSPPVLVWERSFPGSDLSVGFRGDREVVLCRCRLGADDPLAFDRLDAATGAMVGSAASGLGGRPGRALQEAVVSADGELAAILPVTRDVVRVVRTNDGAFVADLPVAGGGAGCPYWASDRPALAVRTPADGWVEWTVRGPTRRLAGPAGYFPLAPLSAADGRVVWLAIPPDARVTGDGWAVVEGPDASTRAVTLGFTPDCWAVDRAGRRLLVSTLTLGSSRALGAGAAVVDLDTGGLVAWLGRPGDPRVVSLALSADGTRALTADLTGRVRLWALPPADGR